MVAIIDYDAGNIRSVEKAIQFLGEDAVITRDRKQILGSTHVILPGVGAFGDAMEKLHQYGLADTIHQVAEQGIPFLGICLGQQIMFEKSEEAPGVEGLGLLKGEIVKIPKKDGLKIPHMGWNNLKIKAGARLFEGVPEDPYVYFVHSYYLKASEPDIVAATTEYSEVIHASVEKATYLRASSIRRKAAR